MINGKTKLFGIIGSNIDDSLSPVLHNTAFKEMYINGVYIPLKVTDGKDLAVVMKSVKMLNFLGLNVTMPYKEDVCAYVDELHGCAESIGVVNTLAIDSNKKIIGYNTDGAGFIKSLDKAKIALNNKKILILGTGGTAKAIAWEMTHKHVKYVALLTREKSSRSLCSCINESNIFEWDSQEAYNSFAEADVIINATPIGMKGYCGVTLNIPWHAVKKDVVCCDVIYTPIMTNFLQEAKERGLQFIGGKNMLMEQADLSRRIWLKYLL